MKETLKELLDKTPRSTIIKVGCGSGWFYCYYNDDLAQTRLSMEDKKTYANIKRILNNHKNAYANLDNKLAKNIKRIKGLKKVSKKEKAARIEKTKKAYERAKIKYPKLIASCQKKYDNYVPFLDRVVKKTYHLDMATYENPNTLYIIIQGKEWGSYCDFDEYVKVKHLTAKKEDNKWIDILSNRDKPERKGKTKTFIKLEKDKKYRVIRDENGKPITIVERKR